MFLKWAAAVTAVAVVAAITAGYHAGLILVPLDRAWPWDAKAIRAVDGAYWSSQGTSVTHWGVAVEGAFAAAIYNGGFSDEVAVFRRVDGTWSRVGTVQPDACSIENAGVPKAAAEALDYQVNHMAFFVHHANCQDSWYYHGS